MTFKQAFELMKQGEKVKLPSWAGYWYWDEDKQTIMMQCKETQSDTGKDLLDIRETQRVEYTLMNILSDEWVIANEENCPLLGGVATFDFNTALRYIKRGFKVKRKYNNKYTSIYLDGSNKFMVAVKSDFGIVNVPMFFTLEDIEATDWMFAE